MAGHHGQSLMIAQVAKGLGLFTFGVWGSRQMAMMPPAGVSGDIIACTAGTVRKNRHGDGGMMPIPSQGFPQSYGPRQLTF
ncbi:hypothetical protein UF64_17885 [Thalassospira sp. HJ]|nr:hypothetical protein UF64_17885 [Thalassospira sp. HJ]